MAESGVFIHHSLFDQIYIHSQQNTSAGNSTNSSTHTDFTFEPRYSALLLSIFVILTLFGNILVVLAVKRNASLHTVTNYLIVSLAVADITVGALVMPFAVYVEVMGGKFLLHGILCDIWLALDVMACTSSIVNMTAISVDRYLAVNKPHFYNLKKTSTWYPVMMISVCWVISIGTCLPIALGANETDHKTEEICTFFNPYFSVTSSCVSFVIPTIVILLFYYRILRVLHTRANNKARASKGKLRSKMQLKEHSPENSGKSDELCIPSSDPPSSRDDTYSGVPTLTFKPDSLDGNSKLYPKGESTEEERGRLITNGVDDSHLQEGAIVKSENNNELPPNENSKGSFTNKSKNTAANGGKRSMSRLNSVVQMAQSRLSKKREERPERTNIRERRAVIMLIVVLCVFLCCWLPFFITNNVQVICKYQGQSGPGCTVPDAVMSFIIWLGYINSMLNPVIYAVFNEDYRVGFIKLLHCNR